MCKSMVGKLIGVSIAFTIAVALLVGGFLHQWSAGPGGLLANMTQLGWVLGMYFVGFIFLGVGKMMMCCDKDHGKGSSNSSARKARR
ncbi:MAG: hypothetical protein HY831_05365 [Candidatus Aenigmarchaeota archaeon]|nr:hypothetical protein [Candidatus Aenigmarchaeota archaeon]